MVHKIQPMNTYTTNSLGLFNALNWKFHRFLHAVHLSTPYLSASFMQTHFYTINFSIEFHLNPSATHTSLAPRTHSVCFLQTLKRARA